MGQTAYQKTHSHQRPDGFKSFNNSRVGSTAKEKFRPINFSVKSQDFLKSAKVVKLRLNSMNYEKYDTINNQWISSEKDEYIYDINGNLTQEIWSEWDIPSSSWVGDWKYVYTYDASGNRDRETSYIWDNDINQWIANYKTDFTYDSYRNETDEIQYNWNEDLNQWDISTTYKHEYLYDNNGNITQKTDQALYVGFDQWFYTGKTQYTYNASGFQTLEINYNWDMINNDWIFSYKYENSDDMTLSIEYNWDEDINQWTNSYKYSYSFNANGDLVEEVDYEWDGVNNQWIGESKSEYSFNNSHTINDLILPFEGIEHSFKHMFTAGNSYEWNTMLSQWDYLERFTFNYSETNISSASNISLVELQTYPNPATDFVTIDLDDAIKPVLIELFDIQGKKVISELLPINKQISVKQLKSGMYFYAIKQNDKLFHGKIMIK